jgi:hypothetical protein
MRSAVYPDIYRRSLHAECDRAFHAGTTPPPFRGRLRYHQGEDIKVNCRVHNSCTQRNRSGYGL